MSNHPRLFMRQGRWFLLITILLLFLTSVVKAQTANQAVSGDGYAAKNYERLKAEEPYYQEAVNHPEQYPWPIIPSDTVLHQGMRDGLVLLLRQRLKTTHDLSIESGNSSYFNQELDTAVKTFQWRHGLTPDGVVGENTIAALNVTPDVRLRQIQLNMQRWAELSLQTGSRFVLVNIPEYELHLIDNDQEMLTIKVIVGRATRQTPELQSRITRLEFNPHWSVPHMIAQNDIVPKIIENPSYLNENKIRIFNNEQEDAYEVNANDVDWQAAEDNGFQYHFRQDPGIKNALGLVKFEFQNTHDVYLHDTPAKALFSQDKRDFSSGCIRLEKPFALVAYLTKEDTNMNSDKIEEILEKRRTTYYRVSDPIPVIITYITAWVDEGGAVHFVSDVYNKDMEPSLMTPQDDGGNGEEKHG